MFYVCLATYLADSGKVIVIQCKLQIQHLVLTVLLLPWHSLLGDLRGCLDIHQARTSHKAVHAATENYLRASMAGTSTIATQASISITPTNASGQVIRYTPFLLYPQQLLR